jgi:hypothetical protein
MVLNFDEIIVVGLWQLPRQSKQVGRQGGAVSSVNVGHVLASLEKKNRKQ